MGSSQSSCGDQQGCPPTSCAQPNVPVASALIASHVGSDLSCQAQQAAEPFSFSVEGDYLVVEGNHQVFDRVLESIGEDTDRRRGIRETEGPGSSKQRQSRFMKKAKKRINIPEFMEVYPLERYDSTNNAGLIDQLRSVVPFPKGGFYDSDSGVWRDDFDLAWAAADKETFFSEDNEAKEHPGYPGIVLVYDADRLEYLFPQFLVDEEVNNLGDNVPLTDDNLQQLKNIRAAYSHLCAINDSVFAYSYLNRWSTETWEPHVATIIDNRSISMFTFLFEPLRVDGDPDNYFQSMSEARLSTPSEAIVQGDAALLSALNYAAQRSISDSEIQKQRQAEKDYKQYNRFFYVHKILEYMSSYKVVLDEGSFMDSGFRRIVYSLDNWIRMANIYEESTPPKRQVWKQFAKGLLLLLQYYAVDADILPGSYEKLMQALVAIPTDNPANVED
ncbi:MAG: hypothetical protein CMP20_15815 [Rickettsiales bacterium]|nr:hypothetical protein [Rickettsiales bacterium]